jgi:hypothetical protein
MGQPIILDGGAQMFTIQLPACSTKEAGAEKFSVSPELHNERFKIIVISDTQTGDEIFTLPLDDETRWKIEIR